MSCTGCATEAVLARLHRVSLRYKRRGAVRYVHRLHSRTVAVDENQVCSSRLADGPVRVLCWREPVLLAVLPRGIRLGLLFVQEHRGVVRTTTAGPEVRRQRSVRAGLVAGEVHWQPVLQRHRSAVHLRVGSGDRRGVQSALVLSPGAPEKPSSQNLPHRRQPVLRLLTGVVLPVLHVQPVEAPVKDRPS